MKKLFIAAVIIVFVVVLLFKQINNNADNRQTPIENKDSVQIDIIQPLNLTPEVSQFKPTPKIFSNQKNQTVESNKSGFILTAQEKRQIHENKGVAKEFLAEYYQAKKNPNKLKSFGELMEKFDKKSIKDINFNQQIKVIKHNIEVFKQIESLTKTYNAGYKKDGMNKADKSLLNKIVALQKSILFNLPKEEDNE